MKKLSILIIFTVFLYGCASSGPVGDLPSISNENQSGQVTIIRNSSIIGITNSYYITLDGKDIYAIRSGEYTQFKLNPGEYHIGVQCFGGWSPTWKESSVKIYAEKSKENFLIINPNMACAEIHSIDENYAKSVLVKSKFIGSK